MQHVELDFAPVNPAELLAAASRDCVAGGARREPRRQVNAPRFARAAAIALGVAIAAGAFTTSAQGTTHATTPPGSTPTVRTELPAGRGLTAGLYHGG
jgi:hypothetical protein